MNRFAEVFRVCATRHRPLPRCGTEIEWFRNTEIQFAGTPNGMKRYLVFKVTFDTRAGILEMAIEDKWEMKVKEMWRNSKNAIIEGLMTQYGTHSGFSKIKNFTEMGDEPFSIISFHNKFLRQARDAFTVGAYYPALTAACALGERILNQLILHLRDSFRATNEYKKVFRKESIDDWDLAISTLEAWNVLLPNVPSTFRQLMDLRHRSLHFNPETDTNDRQLALEAVKRLSDIIAGQFAAVGPLPWLFDAAGAVFIKREQEKVPFVEKIVIPCCHLVGPLHTVEFTNNTWKVYDDHQYEDKEVSDEDFAKMYTEHRI